MCLQQPLDYCKRSQTHSRLLLCQFHAKKAWVDNLLPKVSAIERHHLCHGMCQLMQCITESTFSAQCEDLKVEYANKPGVWKYIEGRWCGLTCVWRKLWPKFGRMFNYGHVDTSQYYGETLAVYQIYCLERENKPINYRSCACFHRGL